MKKLLLFTVITILFSLLSATDTTVDLSVAEDGVTKSFLIPWGNDHGELKMIPPPGRDAMYDGPMNFFVSDGEIFIKEHLENRYFVIDHKSFKNIKYLPVTKNFDPLGLQKPALKRSPDIISLRKKDSLFIVKGTGVGQVNINFVQKGVKSLVFLKKDNDGNIHLLAEKVTQNANMKISVERYWFKADNSGKILKLINLPQQKLYHPENDIFITDKGEIFVIITDDAGLEIYQGGAK